MGTGQERNPGSRTTLKTVSSLISEGSVFAFSRSSVEVYSPHMTVAIVVRSSGQLSFGTLESHIDCTGVHCAKTLIANNTLSAMIVMFQNHRNALCLFIVDTRLEAS